MPGRGGRLPKLVESVASRIWKEKGISPKRALKIAIGNLQRLGHLYPDSLKLTDKGRKQSRKHYGEDNARIKAWKAALRKEQGTKKRKKTKKRRKK